MFTFFSALCTATIQTVIKCIIVIMCVDEFEWRHVEFFETRLFPRGLQKPSFLWHVPIVLL